MTRPGAAADADIDTTALAIQALVAARGGRRPTPTCARVSRSCADGTRRADAWQSFGADDPNSTAVAMFAITAAGFDPTSSVLAGRRGARR